MIRLGFVTAILPEMPLQEVAQFASAADFGSIEVMCWPKGKAERRYAGVTHIDVDGFTKSDAAQINGMVAEAGVAISGLGYYPNPLTPDAEESKTYCDHIKKVIKAASLLGVNRMNTFVGRDQAKTVDDNWPRFLKVWKPLVKYAEDQGVKIGIENCPMSFTRDEWPGGKNLATSPAIWRRMFNDIPSDNFGLNYDPSHLVWQRMDYLAPIREFASKLHHVHAKDARLDLHRLNEVGLLAYPLEYHTPKLPGLGEINWGAFMSTLNDVRYEGDVAVEVEDRAYEGSVEDRQAALLQCSIFLRQYVP